ncbi:MAG: hypothetical protein KF898_06320 [Parachlamydiales bacterium]|nr:hypothetical protein [Verrucomicrobiota bacterium]MBX3719246.1 hypothetical protein [Candidatus Acheromyda pituitae]
MKNRIFINALFAAAGAAASAFAVSPADVLSESQNETQLKGISVRKGTIAATMLNAKAFDEIQKISDPAERKMALEALRREQGALIEGLDAVGLFEFFTPIEWLKKDGQNEGRAWIALLYLQRFPGAISEEVKGELRILAESASNELLIEIAACGIGD